MKNIEIRVATYNIYDIHNNEDPEVIALEKFLEENPGCRGQYWHQQGPCSNWGYDVFRMETDEEAAARIEKEKINKKAARKKNGEVQR